MKTWAILCAAAITFNGVGWADPAPSAAEPSSPQASSLTPEQIDSLVAPIALYPDELVSQVLVACTYPLEVVQAYQWLQQHPDLKGTDLAEAAQKQPWDPSIQALVAFPDVLKRLNQDVTWTTNLGNAFLASQAGVMDEIQVMRKKAEDAGKLASTPQQKVTTKSENGRQVVQIEPASPDVIYVPDYDPVWIWGPAPLYYPYPAWYYPPPPPYGAWCWWGPEIFIGTIFLGWSGWIGWGWHPHWYDHSVVINRTFVEVNHFRPTRFREVHGGAVWVHNPEHRIGVAYPNRALSTHFRAYARPAFTHVSVPQARQEFHAAATRVQADRFGGRQIEPGVYNRNRTAFGGIEKGVAARAQSSRGYSSLGNARSAGVERGGRSSSGATWGGEGGGHSSVGGWSGSEHSSGGGFGEGRGGGERGGRGRR